MIFIPHTLYWGRLYFPPPLPATINVRDRRHFTFLISLIVRGLLQ